MCSIGSSGMLPLALRVRKVCLVLSRSLWGMFFFFLSGCSKGFCLHGRCWLCWSTLSCSQGLGNAGVPVAGHVLWAEIGGGIIFVAFWEFSLFSLNCACSFQGSCDRVICHDWFNSVFCCMLLPVSMVIRHVWYIGSKGHSVEIADTICVRLCCLTKWSFSA